MTITAHCLVKNEENFIWYALQSVLPFVDKVLVWDTGSTDKTVKIIKSIDSPKIAFEEKGSVDEAGHTALRNEMVRQTATDWFMVLDGDEVWSESQLRNTLNEIESLPSNKNCVISKFIFCVGDIYHYSTWGKYGYDWGLYGHYTARFFKNIKNIHWQGKYDHDSLFYEDGSKVVSEGNVFVSDSCFFHLGVLPRSSKDADVSLGHGRKVVDTYFLGFLGHGKKLPKELEFPEVFPSVKLTFIRSCLNFWIHYLPRRL